MRHGGIGEDLSKLMLELGEQLSSIFRKSPQCLCSPGSLTTLRLLPIAETCPLTCGLSKPDAVRLAGTLEARRRNRIPSFRNIVELGDFRRPIAAGTIALARSKSRAGFPNSGQK
jgi:hypothetical protein